MYTCVYKLHISRENLMGLSIVVLHVGATIKRAGWTSGNSDVALTSHVGIPLPVQLPLQRLNLPLQAPDPVLQPRSGLPLQKESSLPLLVSCGGM